MLQSNNIHDNRVVDCCIAEIELLQLRTTAKSIGLQIEQRRGTRRIRRAHWRRRTTATAHCSCSALESNTSTRSARSTADRDNNNSRIQSQHKECREKHIRCKKCRYCTTTCRHRQTSILCLFSVRNPTPLQRTVHEQLHYKQNHQFFFQQTRHSSSHVNCVNEIEMPRIAHRRKHQLS